MNDTDDAAAAAYQKGESHANRASRETLSVPSSYFLPLLAARCRGGGHAEAAGVAAQCHQAAERDGTHTPLYTCRLR